MAAGSTYTPIATTTISSTVSSYTFNSIPNTYTDLVLVIDGLATADMGITLRVNGDTGSNYSRTYMAGATNYNAYSSRDADTSFGTGFWGAANGNRITLVANFMNYSSTSTYKTTFVRQNNPKGLANGNTDTLAQVCLWRSTSAITSITATSAGFGSSSTLTLYGIAAA